MGELFDLYSSIQNLMKYHVIIDETIKNIALQDNHVHDLEPVEMASCAIIEACNEIEKSLTTQSCCRCHLS